MTPRFGTVCLVVLAAVTLVLVRVALQANNASGIDTSPVSSAIVPTRAAPSPSSTPSGTSSPTGTATPAQPNPATALATPLRTMLVAIDTLRAWRVGVGSCSAGGATVAATTDGGKTWADAKAPLRTVVRVRPVDAQSAFVIGADSSCVAELKNTTDGGGTWDSAIDVGRAWFRDPKDPKVVGAPGPSTSQPCAPAAVVDLAAISTGKARVLCADGQVRSTSNSGSSWTDLDRAAGAVALAVPLANTSQTYVALLNTAECAGVQVRRVDQNAPPACVETAAPQGQGQIALSLVDGGGWLAVGDKTMRSTDNLVTWSLS